MPLKPGPPPAKTFTQADVDRIINERLSRREKSIGDKIAELFGGKPSDGDGESSPRPFSSRHSRCSTTRGRQRTT
ncbi:hypothetical protein [Amycolatopsis sp. NPDC004169]|uniref:hypothetical protein n=1 Tax=Amycolatopsis sp. NPDC004169 TaxID=3154453 RepID=UPI0033A1BF8E